MAILANRLSLLIFSMTLLGAQPAQATASQHLVERFLLLSQEIAVDYFKENQAKTEAAILCYERDKDCEALELEAGLESQPKSVSFDRRSFLEEVRQQYRNYRLYAGMAHYQALVMNLRIGSFRSSKITPLPGVGSLYYSNTTGTGKQELDEIQWRYDREIKGIRAQNRWLARASQNQSDEPLPHVEITDLENNYKARVASILKKFPFFTFISEELTERKMLKAMRRLSRTYQRAGRKIANLEGDDRFEIFGFIDVFQRALLELKPEESQRLIDHFRGLDHSPSFLDRVKTIVKNWQMWAMIGCFSLAILSSAFAPLVSTVCGTIGLSMAVPAAFKLGKDILRLKNFGRTGEYALDLYQRMMVNNMVTLSMFAIYFSASIPSFTRNLSNLRTNVAVAVTVTQRAKGRFVELSHQSLVDELKLFWSYANYYGKGVGIESLGDQVLRHGGVRTVVVPAAAHSFFKIVEASQTRDAHWIPFTSLLELSRQLAEDL